ncbi:MAG: hypothetical protein ACPG47_03235 [Leucothrix sp.]
MLVGCGGGDNNSLKSTDPTPAAKDMDAPISTLDTLIRLQDPALSGAYRAQPLHFGSLFMDSEGNDLLTHDFSEDRLIDAESDDSSLDSTKHIAPKNHDKTFSLTGDVFTWLGSRRR